MYGQMTASALLLFSFRDIAQVFTDLGEMNKGERFAFVFMATEAVSKVDKLFSITVPTRSWQSLWNGYRLVKVAAGGEHMTGDGLACGTWGRRMTAKVYTGGSQHHRRVVAADAVDK